MKPVEIEFLMKDRLTPGLGKAGKSIDELAAKASLTQDELEAVNLRMQDLRNIIALLDTQMEQLRLAGTNASPDLDQSANIARIEALQTKIRELEAQLVQLKGVAEKTTVIPESMPQAGQKFNSLHMSIQQLAREMPTLAMGPQIFFMAISNNLPIFADAVSSARKEYEALMAAGQKATPVWKQMLKSLLSWQTAMTAGVMLLTMYGAEIVNWTKNLFTAKNRLEEFNISAQEMVDIEKNGRAEMLKTRFEIDSVISSLREFKGTKEQEKAMVEQLNSKYGESFGYYQTIAEWYDVLTAKGAAYTQMLFLQNKQQALIKKATEADEELAKIEAQKPEEAESSMGWLKKWAIYFAQGQMAQQGITSYDAETIIAEENQKNYDTLMENLKTRRDGFLEEAREISEQIAALADSAGLGKHNKPKTNKDTTEEDRLRALAELGKEMADLRRKNDEGEVNAMQEGTQKKLAQIELEYKQQKEAIDTKAAELKELNRQAGLSPELTGEQQQEIDRANSLNEEQRLQKVTEVYQAEFDAMREHLKEYGNFQQQKLAIAQEYAEKIQAATSEGEKMSLTVERDSKLAGIEAQELKANMDWGTVFGEFGGMFAEVIRPVLADAKAYMQTDEFKNADQASQEALVAAVQQMQESLGGVEKVSFRQLGNEVKDYQNAMQQLKAAQAEYAGTYATLVAAQQEYTRAMAEGSEEERQAAQQALENAQMQAEAATQNINTLQDNATAAQQAVNNTATQLKASMDNVRSGLQQIASGSLTGAYDGLITLGKGAAAIGGKVGDAFGKLADSMENVPVLGWIVSIIDLFKDGISVVIEGLLDAVFDAISGILGDIFSGQLFVTIAESLLEGVSKIFDALTFGAFSNWVGNGESDKNLQSDMELLAKSNDNLRQSIDNLADRMEDAAVSEATDVYERQKQLMAEQMANTQQMMQRSGAAYSNGFLGIGGERSSNYQINNAMSSSDWARISNIVGRNINNASDFWGLSSEEMAKVADEATDLYTKIQQAASSGHEDAGQYMDEYIAYYKELDELQDAYLEKLTGVSFDSVRDSFKSTLLNMDADAETFAESFNNSMLEALVEGMMSEKYTQRLREWYENFANSMKDGDMTRQEIDALRNEYNAIVNDALEERNSIMEATGIDTEAGTGGVNQSAKQGGFAAMTQDQGTKLEGMFTSGLQHWSGMHTIMESVSDKMSSAENHLARIAENTGTSASHLGEIKEEIRKIIRDGLKMK